MTFQEQAALKAAAREALLLLAATESPTHHPAYSKVWNTLYPTIRESPARAQAREVLSAAQAAGVL